MSQTIQLSIILPIHNQEDIIKPIVADIIGVLEQSHLLFEIIMVENGSTDATLSVLKSMEKNDKRLKVLTSPKGYGSAVLCGLKEARGQWVGYMPSDGQIDLSVLPKLISHIRRGNIDKVKVMRINRETRFRFIRSKIFNILSSLVFGKLPVKDINGSPRFFKRKHLHLLDLTHTDSFIDLEFTLKARHLGWKIVEIPMYNLPRAGGESTVSIKTVIEFLRNIAHYRLSSTFNVWKSKVNTDYNKQK